MKIERNKNAARITAPGHNMKIEISYQGLRRALRRLGFSSWSAFRRYSGLSEITVSDLNQGRFIILEKLLFIAAITGTNISDLIEVQATDESGKELTKDDARNAARSYAKKDLDQVKRSALNSAWKLGKL